MPQSEEPNTRVESRLRQPAIGDERAGIVGEIIDDCVDTATMTIQNVAQLRRRVLDALQQGIPNSSDRNAIAAAIAGMAPDEFADWIANHSTYPNCYKSSVDQVFAKADRVLAHLATPSATPVERAEPVAWLLERQSDTTFPRVEQSEAVADALIASFVGKPPVTKRPLYAHPLAARPAVEAGEGRLLKPGFQSEVAEWMLTCFGPEIAADQLERADRFTEEALELAQTMPGFTADRAHALVDYVFGRDVGERYQEVGGVMVTLAALCNTTGLQIGNAAETELARVWTKVETIRAKQAAKPTGSALPTAALAKPEQEGL